MEHIERFLLKLACDATEEIIELRAVVQRQREEIAQLKLELANLRCRTLVVSNRPTQLVPLSRVQRQWSVRWFHVIFLLDRFKKTMYTAAEYRAGMAIRRRYTVEPMRFESKPMFIHGIEPPDDVFKDRLKFHIERVKQQRRFTACVVDIHYRPRITPQGLERLRLISEYSHRQCLCCEQCRDLPQNSLYTNLRLDDFTFLPPSSLVNSIRETWAPPRDDLVNAYLGLLRGGVPQDLINPDPLLGPLMPPVMMSRVVKDPPSEIPDLVDVDMFNE